MDPRLLACPRSVHVNSGFPRACGAQSARVAIFCPGRETNANAATLIQLTDYEKNKNMIPVKRYDEEVVLLVVTLENYMPFRTS